jgi:hypothetical protein
MRWLSIMVIALLVGGVQCISACTLAACAQATQTSQLPPCHQDHQHHQAPAPDRLNTCDHQQAVDTSSTNVISAPMVFVVVELPIPISASGPCILRSAGTDAVSPPGFLSPSVLRI